MVRYMSPGMGWTSPYAGVNELSLVHDVGAFHIDAHGGICESRNNVFITGIWTSTPYSVANDVTFKSQLDADELVYMYARGDVGGHWGWNGDMHLRASLWPRSCISANSVVYIGACYSDAPS